MLTQKVKQQLAAGRCKIVAADSRNESSSNSDTPKRTEIDLLQEIGQLKILVTVLKALIADNEPSYLVMIDRLKQINTLYFCER